MNLERIIEELRKEEQYIHEEHQWNLYPDSSRLASQYGKLYEKAIKALEDILFEQNMKGSKLI